MKGMKVLVIEDNDGNRTLFRTVLELAGHEVLEAADAEVGITLARSEQPDVILMDILLPGMNGLEATRLLRQDEATRAIPVVALSAHASARDKERSLDAGCVGHITKPIDVKTFVQEMEGLVGLQ